LITLAVSAAEQSEAEVLSQAEAAFAEGVQARGPASRQAFAKAATDYEELRLRGVHNPALYRNQGDAYLLAGDVPRAILAYRRGVQLAPNDAALRANLANVRDQVLHVAPGTFGRPPLDHWPPWVPRLTTAVAVWMAVAVYGVACVFFTRWFMTRRSGLVGVAGIAGLLAGSLAVYATIAEKTNRQERQQPLVVVTADRVTLHKGNGRSYPSFPWPLPRGAEARVRFQRNGWLQIELAGGEVGWVPRTAVVLDDEA
jgi:hypothetical protein